MILGLTLAEGLGLGLTVLTSILLPFIKKRIKKRKDKIKKEKEQKDNDTKLLLSLDERLSNVNKNLEALTQTVEFNKTINDNLQADFKKYKILNIKYIINDAFFGYHSVHEIPYETLLIAAEGCDIYIGEGHNHEIGARCEIIYKEFQRREKLKGEGVHHE
jgi:hypothetical protein